MGTQEVNLRSVLLTCSELGDVEAGRVWHVDDEGIRKHNEIIAEKKRKKKILLYHLKNISKFSNNLC